MLKRGLPLVAILSSLLLAQVASAATQVWQLDEGTVTFSLSDTRLADLGLELVGPRTTADVSSERARELSFEDPIYSFRIPATGLELVVEDGAVRLADEAVAFPVEGGLAFRAENPRSRQALEPAYLYDFAVELDTAQERLVLGVHTLDPSLPTPLEIRNSNLHLDREHGVLSYRMADLQITRAWADRLGQPELAGTPLGLADVRFSATLVRGVEALEPTPDFGGARGGFQDVKLGELYGLSSYGHIGTFPTGRSGLSAATTSCNIGDVDVPWNAPMAETHPFIGLALFRESNGILEMIGKNWMKHGFFALSSSQCTSCQHPSGGQFLGVGCSDTYSAGNNASRTYLGPRAEVDPYFGTWEACGSFFDGANNDCQRSYFGSEPNEVNHRLEVDDVDLNVAGATFYYEGIYVIANEDDTTNEIGWRQISNMSWGGSQWNISTAPGEGGSSLHPFTGPLLMTWGDTQWMGPVSASDGEAILATQVTDNGDGTWHYEYALYNRRSARMIDGFTVPVGTATITNVGFHDVDNDSGNDWTATVSGGNVVWSTSSQPLPYQTMFNFRFDANAAPTSGQVIGDLFRSGATTSFEMDGQVPAANAVSALASERASGLSLSSEPNPFTESTRLSFSVPTQQEATLQVLDVTGRTVRTLVHGPVPAGVSRARWDGRDAQGRQVASGVYFFRLTTADGPMTVKSTFLR